MPTITEGAAVSETPVIGAGRLYTESEVAALRAESERLREALRPFALYWTIKRTLVGTPRADTVFAVHAQIGAAEVTVVDFDRACAALDGGEK